jgi:tripartite ATP-independent transporter DctM subunit
MPLDLLMFVAMIGVILLGFPVSFAIAGVATTFAFLGYFTGQMNITLLGALGQRLFGVLTNDILIAIPLFVFMGALLEKSGIAEELLETMGRLFGKLRGGLGVSVILVGAMLAASTGIVGATVVAMGLIALPAMLRTGYQPAFASGIVCSAGTLGQLIPPSTILIILADVIANAYQQAQYKQGKFTIDTISVGQLFAAALIPGIVVVILYILYVLIRAWLRPDSAPAVKAADYTVTRADIARAILPPILLIIAVLGAILGGVASPTEAASVGAIGALLMVGNKYGKRPMLILLGAICLGTLIIAAGVAPVRLQRTDATSAAWALGAVYGVLAILGMAAVFTSAGIAWKKDMLKSAMMSTMVVTSMIFATILTASAFSLVFVGLGGEDRIAKFLTNMPGGANGALLFTMVLIFILGCFLDFVEITVILLPLVTPVLMGMGFDPVWLAILFAINLQTSFLTPPFGFSLFYLRGAAPPEITTMHIYRGVAPFIALNVLAMLIIWQIPWLTTWLPKILF